MKDVVLDACERALDSMLELDCDDAGVNQIGFIGWFWGNYWFVAKCVSYDPSPNMEGRFSLLVCDATTMQSPMDEGWMAKAFDHCVQQIFLDEQEVSAENLTYQVQEWHNLEQVRNIAEA